MGQTEIWLVGGDGRQAALASLLAADGYRVRAWGLEEILQCEERMTGPERASGVILPLPALDGSGLLYTPCSRRRIMPQEVLDRLQPGQKVMAGRVTEPLARMAEERELILLDYFDREEVAVSNAVPTAEGAIRIAMETMPITVHGARILILGYGRVGQALGIRLRALGAQVEVTARRREQLALAESHGLRSIDLSRLQQAVSRADLVVNTVPALILGAEELAAVRRDAAVLELASHPGGVDRESAAALGVKLIRAPGLPGKEAPLTAGRILRDAVYHLLEG